MAFDQKEHSSLLGLKDEKTFELIFKKHFKNLQQYAYTIVRDEVVSEEVVQQIFFKIWERKEHLNLQIPTIAYLYRAVYNESCNFLKHQKVKNSFVQYSKHTMQERTIDDAGQKLQVTQIKQQIKNTLSELPEQSRTIFQLSRFEELKYFQIAEKLGISIKTVEAHMSKVLKTLRVKLVDFLPLLVMLIINSIIK